MRRWLKLIGRPALGVTLCTATAMAASFAFAHHPWRIFVPLAFSLVVVLLAVRFGLLVGIMGSLAAAGIFAHYMFAPVGSLRVSDTAARGNLAWMLLASIVLSFLTAPTHPHDAPVPPRTPPRDLPRR